MIALHPQRGAAAGGNETMNQAKTRRLTGLALLTAIVVVLQIVATYIKFGPFAITLALAPIIIGAALYGTGAGAFLGAVFGAVVLIMCIAGQDPGGYILWSANPFLTAILCLLKGAAAGFFASLVFKALEKKNPTAATVAAGVVSPVANTGIFLLGLALFFHDILVAWAGGSDLLIYVFTGLVGVNFVVELVVNLVLATVIVRIIHARKTITG